MDNVTFEFESSDDGTACEATLNRARKTIESMVLRDLEGVAHEERGHEPSAHVAIGGAWLAGRFEVVEVRTCCLHFAAEIYRRLLAPDLLEESLSG